MLKFSLSWVKFDHENFPTDNVKKNTLIIENIVTCLMLGSVRLKIDH